MTVNLSVCLHSAGFCNRGTSHAALSSSGLVATFIKNRSMRVRSWAQLTISMQILRSIYFIFLHSFLSLLPLSVVLFTAPPFASASAAPCTTTAETHDIVADSQGSLCSIEELDTSGCCPKQKVGQFGDMLVSLCKGQCCNHYAACVHNCMSDDSARDDVLAVVNQKRFRVRDSLDPEKVASFFNICRDVCRTHSGSVTNGNLFISDFRFCYGSYIGLPPPPLPSGIRVIAAQQGVSCEEACSNQNLRCKVDAFPSLNACSLLSKHFDCKDGCSHNFGEDQPAYVASQSDAHFGKCLINSDPHLFSCSGKHASTRRLCPCA